MLVMSCNVAGGLRKHWGSSLEIIRKFSPDLFGCQELYFEQKLFYLEKMPWYECCGALDRPASPYPDASGENPRLPRGNPVNGVFYRRDNFKVVSSGAHWLSQAPHVCGSKSWESSGVRLANWLILQDVRSEKLFRICNTHLDHVSQSARENQSRMINESAAAYPGDTPQILTGDMNAALSNRVIRNFLDNGWRDTYFDSWGEYYSGISWHGLEGDACARSQDVPGSHKGQGRIDWVFVRGPVISRDAGIIKDVDSGGQFPSDHYFVSAEIELQ